MEELKVVKGGDRETSVMTGFRGSKNEKGGGLKE
jgi:hypothetical protein